MQCFVSGKEAELIQTSENREGLLCSPLRRFVILVDPCQTSVASLELLQQSYVLVIGLTNIFLIEKQSQTLHAFRIAARIEHPWSRLQHKCLEIRVSFKHGNKCRITLV